MRRFQVRARRRGAGWELHIEGVGAATAAKVTQAEAVARESIAAALGVPDDSFAVDVVVCLAPEIEAMIRQAREAARQAAQAQQEAARQAHQTADTLEARYEAETAIKGAAKLKAVANRIDREPTGLRTRQVARVTDYRALIKHIFANDAAALEAWLDEYARKSLPAQLPGVIIETERRAA